MPIEHRPALGSRLVIALSRSILSVALTLAMAPAAGAESHAGSFSYSNGVVYVDVLVNEETPAVCLIDTGANVSAIDTQLAERLDLLVLETSTVVGTTGSIEVQNVSVDALSIHGAEATELRPTRRDLSQTPTPDGRPLGLIVGFDFLRHFAMDLDFANRWMVLYDESPSYPISIPFELDSNIPRVRATINETIDVEFRLDTGAALGATDQVYLNITTRDWNALQAADPDLEPIGYATGAGVGGETRLIIAEIDALDLGPFHIDQPRVIVQPEQGYFANNDAVGFISNNLLEKSGRVIIDYHRRAIGLLTKPELKTDEPAD